MNDSKWFDAFFGAVVAALFFALVRIVYEAAGLATASYFVAVLIAGAAIGATAGRGKQ